jgi:protein-tyrosine phosphatase
MAAAYLEKRVKELGRKDIIISSAGIAPFPGMQATREAQQVLKEEGADISNHVARKITDMEIREADLIFAMEDIHRRYLLSKDPETAGKTYLLKDFKKIGDFNTSDSSSIQDPIGKNIDFYRKTFSVIKEAIERVLKEIDGKKD